MKIDNSITGNKALRFIDLLNEVNEIKSDLNIKQKMLTNQMYSIFLDCVNIECRIESTVIFDNTNLEYSIVDVDVVIHTNDNKEKEFVPYVYLVRVKKGTKELLKAYQNGTSPKAYAKRIPAYMIKKVVIH